MCFLTVSSIGGSLPGCEGVGHELELPAFFSFKLLFPLLGVDGPGIAGQLTASCDMIEKNEL